MSLASCQKPKKHEFAKKPKTKRLQKWDARVLLTRDLKHPNQHNELYQITYTKPPKNVIFLKWGASFFYPKINTKNHQQTNQKNRTRKIRGPKKLEFTLGKSAMAPGQSPKYYRIHYYFGLWSSPASTTILGFPVL